VPAESPTGAPAFQDVADDPPTTEPEFIGLWKVYFLGLIATVLKDYGVQTEDAKRVYAALREAGARDRPPMIAHGRSGQRPTTDGHPRSRKTTHVVQRARSQAW
jgi:hypothetical protein